MKILKFVFVLAFLNFLSCNNDDNGGSNEITYPITYTADYYTENTTKVYTSEGEITDKVILEKFIANNLDNIPFLNNETELHNITIEYTSPEKGIITEVTNNQTVTKNVTIINQEGTTYLENEEIFTVSAFGYQEDEIPTYKFSPLFLEFEELPSNWVINSKECVYAKANNNELQLYQMDLFSKKEASLTSNLVSDNNNISVNFPDNLEQITISRLNNSFNVESISKLKNSISHYYYDAEGKKQKIDNIKLIPSNIEEYYTDTLADTLLISEYKLILKQKNE